MREIQKEPISKWVMESPKRFKAHHEKTGKKELVETVKGTPGLSLVTRRADHLGSWQYGYHWNGKQAKITFGPAKLDREQFEVPGWGDPMTIGRAKELAEWCRSVKRQGRDPKPMLAMAKEQAGNAQAIMDTPFAKLGHLVDDLFRDYVSDYNYRPTKGRRASDGTVKFYAALLGLRPKFGGWEPNGNGVLSHWQGRVYSDFEGNVKLDHQAADVILKAITAPSMSNKTVEALHRFGDWAIYAKRAATNPFANLKPLYDSEPQERLLSDAEIAVLWNLAETSNDATMRAYGASAQLMLLTIARPGAARRVKWTDLDLEQAIWYLPASERQKLQKAKLGRHPIPLSALALQVLRAMPVRGDYVFTLNGSTPIAADQTKVMDKFRKQVGVALGRDYASEGEATADDPFFGPWQWRDIRRTVATRMSELQLPSTGWPIPADLIEKIQDHAPGKVKKAYFKSDYLTFARQALDMWADTLAGIVNGTALAA